MIYGLKVFGSYSRDVVGFEGCYLKGTLTEPTSVKVGDIIVCRTGFEVNSTDAISKLRYTLTYGSGLKLVGEEKEDTYVLNKTGNTYEINYKKATPVDTGIITYEFEVISEENLTCDLTGIKFITSDGKKYTSGDENSTFTATWGGNFASYKRNVVGIEGCQIDGTFVDISDEPGVSVGDVIVCRPGFEVDGTDAISKLRYTLTYGSGLELMGYETEDTYVLNKTGNTYEVIYNEATGVDTGSMLYQFRVVSETDLTYGLSDIKFITSNGSKYKSENKSYKFTPAWSGYFVTYSRNVVGIEGCQVNGAIVDISDEPGVSVGDVITCRPGFEVDSTDAISRLKYTLTYGSGLSLVGEEAEDTYELRKTENTYEIVYDEATPVDTAVIAYEFEVVSETNLTYGLTDIKFVTSGGSKYQSGDSNYSF